MADDDSRQKGTKLPDLDWAERLFGAAHRWLGRKSNGPVVSDQAATLDDLEPLLLSVARILGHGTVLLRPSEALGGVRGSVILLPPCIDLGTAEENREFYVLRTSVAAAQVGLPFAVAHTAGPLFRDLQTMQWAAQAVGELSTELEAFRPRFDIAMDIAMGQRRLPDDLRGQARELELLRRRTAAGHDFDVEEEVTRLERLPVIGPSSPPLLLYGGPLSSADEAAAAVAEEQAREESGTPADGTEFEAPAKDEIVRRILDQDDDAEVAPIHLFEKVETVDAYDGGSNRSDGDDDLEDHLEALDEVDLRQIIRGGTDTHSVFRADLEGLSDIPDVADISPTERGIPYDEWDAPKACYRREWSTVYPSSMPNGKADWGLDRLAELDSLRRKLEQRLLVHRHARDNLTRQADGDDIDLNALVEWHANRKAERSGGERLYIRRPRTRRSLATTVLIDSSLSADSWVDNKRVLTVTRDAALLLGEVACRLGDELQLLAFASHTRNRCRVWMVKDWHDSWAAGRARLGELHPQGYTRIGPALRHATSLLQKSDRRHRLLLVITDGKPTDLDRYEGAYGVADVGRATMEARKLGIAVHAVGIDRHAASALPRMFGVGGWTVLRNLGMLPEVLVEAYGRATAV